MSSGRVSDQPTELLQSEAMRELLADQREVVDFIIIDCPPVLAVADALVVAPMADAILYVANEQLTPRGAVIAARAQLDQVGAQAPRRRPQRRRGQGDGLRLLRPVHLRTATAGERDRLDMGSPAQEEPLRRSRAPHTPTPATPDRRWSCLSCSRCALRSRSSSSSACGAISWRAARRSPPDAGRHWRAISEAARTSFAEAAGLVPAGDRSLAHGPVGSLARAVPWLGNTADTVRRCRRRACPFRAPERPSRARSLELPDGIGSLAPANGVVPIDRYADLAAAVDRPRGSRRAAAADTLDRRTRALRPTARVARPLGRAGAGHSRSRTISTGSRSCCTGSAPSPARMRPRRYLVLAQNPAELRGTGGIWGAYAILTLRDGRAHVSSARPTQTLRDFPAGRVPSPSEDYARTYDQFGGAGSWQNMNATPDFPSAAQAALANYALGEGERARRRDHGRPVLPRSRSWTSRGPSGCPGSAP